MSERTGLYLRPRRGLGYWLRSGEPMVWFNAGAVTLSIFAVLGLLGLLAWQGMGYFWPRNLLLFSYLEQNSLRQVLGEEVSAEIVPRDQLLAAGVQLDHMGVTETRLLVKRGNRDFFVTDFAWLLEARVREGQQPADAIRVERLEWGNLYGTLHSLLDGEQQIAEARSDPDDSWAQFQLLIDGAEELRREIRRLERDEVGRINYAMEKLRQQRRSAQERGQELEDAAFRQKALDDAYARIRTRLLGLYEKLERYQYRVQLADGQLVTLPVGKVVRAIKPNSMNLLEKADYYIERLWEFLSDEPREANTEGGVYPAIFGTVLMVLLMSIMVTPFGVTMMEKGVSQLVSVNLEAAEELLEAS